MAAAAFGAAACSEAPTGPETAVVRIDATAIELAATRVVVADVTSRIFPSISALSGVAELEGAVAALALSVQRVNAVEVDRDLRRAADALRVVRASSTDAESPDLAAIDLAIGSVTEILVYPANVRTSSNVKTP